MASSPIFDEREPSGIAAYLAEYVERAKERGDLTVVVHTSDLAAMLERYGRAMDHLRAIEGGDGDA